MSEKTKENLTKNKAIKLLISGTAGSGKTTLLSTLTDAVVFSYDNKDFSLNIPHRNMHHKEHGGTIETGDIFKERANELLEAYKTAKGEYPKTFVIDSISTIAGDISNYCNTKFSGFTQWSEFSKEITKVNNVINKLVTEIGINVILITHAQFNGQSEKWEDTTKGSFNKKEGGFFATVDYGIFIEALKNGTRMIYLDDAYRISRTKLKLTDEEKKVNADNFSLQGYIDKILTHNNNVSKYSV